MKPHGRGFRVKDMSEQASASGEGQTGQPGRPRLPGTSSGRGSPAEDFPPRRGMGRGKLLALGQSSDTFTGRSTAQSQPPKKPDTRSSESTFEKVSKKFHEVRLQQKQDTPPQTEGPAPAVRPWSGPRPAAADKPGPAPRPVATEKPGPTPRPAATEKPGPAAKSAATGKGSRKEKPKRAAKPTATGKERQQTETHSKTQTERRTPASARPFTGEDTQLEKLAAKGKNGTLLSNFVRLRTDPDMKVYEYEVTFSPELEFVNFRYKLLFTHFPGKREVMCYDGNAKLSTPEMITDGTAEYVSRHPNDDSSVIMTLKLKRIAEPKDCASLYNTLFHNCSRILRFTRFGSKYFDSEDAVDIPQHKLEIWPGYVTSIDKFDGGILLRCDINHRVLRTETVLDVISSLKGRGTQFVKAMASKDLVGQCVLTRYNNSLYRIDDIDWEKNPLSTFTLKSGEEISFLQYYKRQYNLDILDTKQPLLINRGREGRGGNKNIICLVPEICHMTGLNDTMRNDVKVMKDIARYTRITPSQRVYAFKKFLDNVRSNVEVQNLLGKWGLKIMDDFVELNEKTLEPETLVFGKNQRVKPINFDWIKSLRTMNVYRPVNIKTWIVLFPSRNHHVAEEFTNMVKKLGPGLGIHVQDPTRVSLRDDRIESYINGLKSNIDSTTQIVVCICPTAREDRYNAIKKFCCKEVPIPSQVVNVLTLSREDRMRAVVQNIALQMNHKMGGAGWAIQIPFNRTMVCGVDAYHDKSHSGGSVGAFVASSNNDCTEWFSRTNFQGPKEEFISGIVDAFTTALNYYRKKNQAFPDRIVVFRDGVSDGQLETCLQYEVSQFLNAFKIAKYEYHPEFVFIIVQKRISTKLYKIGGGEIENPTPGGVVDTIITKKGFPDFYLVSQLVRSGTASPTHYIVLYDNSKTNIDYLQRLTYKFCHLYYNWPGTIRVPAPCQYAHKLAYLVGQNIKCKPDESLENKLYYL